MAGYIFFDIDGTIWDEKMEIPQSTIKAMKKLKENGHKTFLCSGRSRSNILDEELLALDFDGIIAACGNHIELDGEIIYENLIEEELLHKAISVLGEQNMPLVLEGPEYHWVDRDAFLNDPYVDYLLDALKNHIHPLTGYQGKYRVNKYSADITDQTDFEEVQRQLEDDFDFLVHEGNVVEFVPKGTSKATGIAKLCEILHIDWRDTYAIGDSVNDLDMFEIVEHAIAMGNGSDVAKEAADYVTKPIHEDGLYHAMEHFHLI